MSYPNNLGARINHITNYSTNSVKLNPDNSATELEGVTSGARMHFTLPPNSLVDLSSLSVYADFETAVAISDAADGARPHYLTRNVNSLIKRLTVEIGGQVVSDIEDYNRINQIFNDYQFGIEGSSKKLLSNVDPLHKTLTNGVQVGGLRPLETAGPPGVLTANVRLDKRPICMSQFLGFLGGGAGVKYLDTQLTGNIKITFELAPANNVLFRASQGGLNGNGTAIAALANANCVAQAQYSLKNVFATIKKSSIDDGVYFQSVTAALSAGIPFEYKYNHFYQTKSNATNGDLTMRYEVMSNSVDLAMLTFYTNAYNTAVADLPDKVNLEGKTQTFVDAAALIDDARAGGDFYAGTNPILNAKTLALAGKENCFASGYFKRSGNFIGKTKFYLNGESMPQFDMKNPQVFNQSLIDFGIHDDTANGIYYGINSYNSWEKNYWVATARLSHVCNDDTYISGYNANGVPLTISVETSSNGNPNADYTAQLYVMTTEVLQVYAGRQINRMK